MSGSNSAGASSSAMAAASPKGAQVETNPRGIPQAPFVSNVEEHIGGPDAEVDSTLRSFQEAVSKYKFMEMNQAQRRRGLLEKIPEIRSTLKMVEFLNEKKEADDKVKTTFELNDTLYAHAEVDNLDMVYLWLGANVMLSYPIPEALDLLRSKLASAEKSLKEVEEDLDFLREQTTVMEVNTARVHNWDVKRRRERRLRGEAEPEKEEEKDKD